jgi:hypothetical protein
MISGSLDEEGKQSQTHHHYRRIGPTADDITKPLCVAISVVK